VGDSSIVKPSFRLRRTLALLAVAAAMAIAVPRFLTHTPYQRMGVRMDWSASPTEFPTVGAVVGPPGQGVLERGDRILTVDDVPFTREELKKRGVPPSKGPLRLEVERDGEVLTLTLPPLQLSAWQRARMFMAQVVSVVAVPLIATLLVWRRPDLSVAWVFLWFSALQAVGTIWAWFRFPQVEPQGFFKTYLGAYEMLCLWLPAAFLHFMTVFPRPRWRAGTHLRSAWFWLLGLAYLAPLAIWLIGRMDGHTYKYYAWFQAVAIPLGCLALIARYARPPHPGWAPKATERVLAILVALALLSAAAIDAIPESAMMTLFSSPLFRGLTTAVIFAWLASPILIAYLIANDPVFDPRRIAVRGIPYAVLTGVLAALYLGTVVVSQNFFSAATGEEAVAFNVLAALVVAFAFAPIRDRLQRGLDRLYGRDPHAMRMALDQAGRELLGALNRDEVRGAVEAAVHRGFRRRVEVLWPHSGTPRLADPEELSEEERSALESLLLQAGIRLENLSLQMQRAAAERRAVEMREAKVQAELRALHAQVQPHFLFNALNALSYLTETDPSAAQRFTERLADMLRYTVEAGERPAALLSDEIAFVEDYLGVARERYENPLSFAYDGARDLLSTAVPPLLLQPLVENSLKHGCSPGADALHLVLEARRDDGWVTLTFRDDGAGSGNGTHGFGLGLQNLEQRVRLFGGAEASVAAAVQDRGGFAVTMRWRASAREAA
jgi:hypothetical protein